MSVDPLARVSGRWALWSGVALVVASGIGYAIAGAAGLYGALLGIGFPTLFLGLTLAVALVTKRRSGPALGAVILGSWLVKLIALIAVLAVLKPLTFYDRPVFAVAFLGWTTCMLLLETTVIKHTRQPYVEPV